MVSVESQPFSSCAIVERRHHRGLLLIGGYLASALSIAASAPDSTPSVHSSVDFPEHDVLRADDRDHVGDHVTARHFVERGEVRKPGARILSLKGLLAPV
jgi:hypothetical protein